MLMMKSRNEIKTDEDFKKCLKKKTLYYTILFVLGVLTTFTMHFIYPYLGVVLPDYTKGFFIGIGSGLMGISIILLVKNRRIMNSPKLLHKIRVSQTDERNIEISKKALIFSIYTMLFVMYFVMLIGGIWYPVLSQAICGLICAFVLIYSITFHILNKRM